MTPEAQNTILLFILCGLAVVGAFAFISGLWLGGCALFGVFKKTPRIECERAAAKSAPIRFHDYRAPATFKQGEWLGMDELLKRLDGSKVAPTNDGESRWRKQ